MNLNHAIIIIAAMFTAMLAWNIWWLFFSKEAIIFKSNKNMTAPIQPDASRVKLEKKMEQLQSKREQLMAEVTTHYSADKLRELNVLDHHIRVTSERLCGQWYRETPEPCETALTK